MVFDHDLQRNVAIRVDFTESELRGHRRHNTASEDRSNDFIGLKVVFTGQVELAVEKGVTWWPCFTVVSSYPFALRLCLSR